ncbi:MAG: zinc-dependent alcohol dehydrogenase [Armatimonadota bacterium]
MKAAIVEKPGVLTVREIPEPEMGEYDARCEMLYGATCSGTDGHLIAGRFPWPIEYPAVLGHESVGRITAVGSKVRNFKVGDVITRVGTAPSPTGEFDVCWGGFCEVGLARDHQAMCVDRLPTEAWRPHRWNLVVPEGIVPAAATMIITWRETLSYLTRMGFDAGASLLVIGSGGNGLSYAAHAANLGASQVSLVGSPRRETNARAAGAGAFYDYATANLAEIINETSPDGFDFIIDAVGKCGALDDLLPCVKDGGVVSIYGIDDFGACRLTPTRARGSFTYANHGYDEAETHHRVIDFMQQGKLDAGIWLDLAHPFPLERITDAFAAVERREVVKALVKLS